MVLLGVYVPRGLNCYGVIDPISFENASGIRLPHKAVDTVFGNDKTLCRGYDM
jgi:hypothetical protein